MIILVVVLTSGIQIWLTNKGLSELILEANAKLFNRIAIETQLQLNKHYGTAFTAIGAFTKSYAVNSPDIEVREKLIPQLAQLLNEFPHVTSYSFYYPSGDLLSIARVNDKAMAERGDLNTTVKFIIAHNHKGILKIRGVDKDLQLISEIEPGKAILYKSHRWFSDAQEATALISTPSIHPTSEMLGVFIYRKNDQGVVISAEVLLEDLQQTLTDTLTNASSLRVLYNDEGQIFAVSDSANKTVPKVQMTRRLDLLPNKAINYAIKRKKRDGQLGMFYFEGEKWFGHIATFGHSYGQQFHLLMAAKADDLFDNGVLIKKQTIYTSLLILLLILPGIYVISMYISQPIKRATRKAKDIESFKFDKEHVIQHCYIREIAELNQAQSATQSTISQFISLTNNIANKENLDEILSLVCHDTAQAVEASGIFLYLHDIDNEVLVPKYVWYQGMEAHQAEACPLPVSEAKKIMEELFAANKVMTFEAEEIERLNLPWDRVRRGKVVCMPLMDRSGSVIGSFGLLFEGDNALERYHSYEDYLTTLLGFTSVTIETHELIEAQKSLLDSFIQVFAGSLDRKSPYTGNHCQRVPIITEWLTKAAQNSQHQAFENFSLTPKQWEELKMASWLHDCGKITTPEHIVDKATKLETIYNRIHEVRMRFEVVKREKEIELLKIHFGELPDDVLKSLNEHNNQVDNDFEFVAELNLGGEFVDDAHISRLHDIAQRTWTRTLSKTAGTSWIEQHRSQEHQPIPATECVLADLPEHLVPWNFPRENEECFTLKAPDYQANLGEIYNLSTRRGTLTDEDRFIINDHIIQSINILKSLPFPKHMRDVVKIAGGHHEKIDGT
ncbi:HD domain-containing phosphohydrolase, partial [Vibrio cyclitrophicus]